MIEFVFGREPSSKTEYVIEKIKKALTAGKRCILLIPEQQALFWDTAAAERFEPTDALNIETLSFKRLANSVFRTFGGVAKRYVTDAEKTLIMWSAISSVAPRLKAFRSPDREDRYVPLMLHAVNELKLYGISPESLTDAAEKMGEKGGSLPLRLNDLALIAAAYDTLLHDRGEDPEEIPDALCRMLEEHDYFKDTCVFVDSFYTLTPKEMKVMRHIFAQAEDVLVTFAMTGEDVKDPHMEYVSDYMKELARIVSRLGLDIKKTECTDGRRAEFAYLSKNLWNYGAAPYKEGGDCISLIKCPDRYDEAILAGARIRALAAQGARFSSIACVSADFEALRGITDIELERQGIPVYVSGKTTVTSQPAVRLLLGASAVCAGGWKKEDIISCLRTGLCGITPDEADAIEMYTHKWRIRGKNRYCCDGWAMNADGYCAEESRWARELLTLANSAREKLIPPIEAFSEAFPGKVRDVCAAAYKLLCDFGVYDRLKSEVSALETVGKLADAQKKAQVWDAIIQVLDTLALSVPDTTVDARRFAALLRRTADTCHIGSIPDGIDRVVLGSVGSVRLDSIDHLIVLGAKSGEFPRVPKEGSFFSDADREELKALGIELSPDSAKCQREEMFRFAQTVCAPKKTLTLFIPSDPSGNHPSLGATRLMKLFPSSPVWDFTCPEGEAVIRSGGKDGDSLFEGALSADCDRTTGNALAKLFDRDINLTQTRIECFNSCAFKYYCEHILRLDDVSMAELKPSDVGNFVHSILEHFMKQASDSALFPMTDELVVSRAERLIREYRESVLPDGENGYVDYMFDRLSSSIKLFARALNAEFSQSRFTPHSFELKVGFSDYLPAVPIPLENGHSLTVRGIVDRMDVFKDGKNVYIRVVDYKTGSKTFSLKKALKGENIQLLLYLFALCSMPRDCGFAKTLVSADERLIPAGAVYFSAKPGDIAANDLLSGDAADSHALDAISRTGIVLGNSEVMEAMDKELSGKYCPAYIDKNGKMKGTFAESEEDFADIKATLDEFLGEVGNRMISGEAGSCPEGYMQSCACNRCSMKPLCRHSQIRNEEDEGGEGDE